MTMETSVYYFPRPLFEVLAIAVIDLLIFI